jgi:hypothetical protein
LAPRRSFDIGWYWTCKIEIMKSAFFWLSQTIWSRQELSNQFQILWIEVDRVIILPAKTSSTTPLKMPSGGKFWYGESSHVARLRRSGYDFAFGDLVMLFCSSMKSPRQSH